MKIALAILFALLTFAAICSFLITLRQMVIADRRLSTMIFLTALFSALAGLVLYFK